MTLNLENYNTQIVFVSEQTAPNYFPALDPQLEPKTIVLVITPKMRNPATSLAAALQNAAPALSIEYCNLDNEYDLLQISDTLERLIADLKNRGLKPLFNITGGTKAMTIAAMLATENNNVPAFYLPLNTDRIIFVRELEKLRLNTSTSLRNYLTLYGFQMETAREELAFRNDLKELAHTLVGTDSFRQCYPTINFLASKAQSCLQVKLDEVDRIPEAGNALLDKFEEAGLLHVRNRSVQFADEPSRFFVNGGWLEDLAAYEAGLAFPETKVHKNLKIVRVEGQKKEDSTGADNELDVVFMLDGKLCFLECKTTGENGTQKKEDAIYKLDSLSQKFGKTVCPILVSYQPLREAERKRAEKLHIGIIDGDNLKRFGERLKAIIRKKEF